MHVNVIWLRISGKPDCINGSMAVQQSFDHTMHAIHHTAVGREDDRETQIRRLNEPNMLDHRSPTCSFVRLRQERLSNFTNVAKWNVYDWEVSSKRDESINIPREKSPAGVPEVI